MKILTNMDLNQNELQNVVLQPLATAPSNPREGQIYYDSLAKVIKRFDGKEWRIEGAIIEESDSNGHVNVDGVDIKIYELNAAGEGVLGGIKPGAGISVTEDGTASIDINYYTGIRQTVNEVAETDNEVFNRILGTTVPHEGDIFIVKTLISGDKYSYSSFVYDNGWCAMDGNVDATNVIMRDDIITAGSYTQVGNVTKGSTATGSISAKGKSIADVLTAIFTKELNPTKTDPKVTLTLSEAGAHEVGSEVAISYTATLSAGSYTYGPATGVIAESWSISDTAGNTSTSATGTFADVEVTDTLNYKLTATASHNAGTIPKTNLGNDYTAVQIAAGTKEASSGAITGYRAFFYGAVTDPIELTSANIRTLTNSGKAVGTSQKFDITLPEGARQVIVAFPTSTAKTLSSVLDKNAFGTDVVGSFVKSTIDVEGANNYTAVSYDVWVFNSSTALSANTYTVTIA